MNKWLAVLALSTFTLTAWVLSSPAVAAVDAPVDQGQVNAKIDQRLHEVLRELMKSPPPHQLAER